MAGRRESPSGQSYFGLYQNCPRKFFIKYPLGIMSIFTSLPLLMGSAFHEGKAAWYKTGDMDKALRKARSTLSRSRAEFENKDVYENSKDRTVKLLTAWICDWGKQDLDLYKPLEVEREHSVSLPNGFRLTVRPDAVLKRKDDKRIFVMETKTTGFSKLIATQGVEYGDQATAYLWALSQVHPDWKIEAVLPDVSYWHKNSTDESKIANVRDAVVKRDKRQLREFALSTMNILSDISQRIAAVRGGLEPLSAFPRNTQWCTSYFRPCEYINICRTQIKPGDIPQGFKRDPWSEEHEVLKFPKIGENHEQVRRKKKKTNKIQMVMRDNTTGNVVTGNLWRCLTRYTILKNPGRRQSLVALDSMRRERSANFLCSWAFCRLPQARRKRYIAALSNGFNRKKNSERLLGRMDRTRIRGGKK